MGQMTVSGKYTHQSEEKKTIEGISRAEFDTMLRRLDGIGGNYEVEAIFTFCE